MRARRPGALNGDAWFTAPVPVRDGPQLVALMDKREAPFVAPLVLRAAHDYPEAVRYAFQVFRESCTFEAGAHGDANRRAIEAIADQVRPARPAQLGSKRATRC